MKGVLHSGWLTKSPPEKKTQGPWKIFKSQWRRRFFVLSNVHASVVLPGSCPAQLEYFDSDKQTKRKGCINLNNCEQVVANIESESYSNIFVVKTTDRGNQRDYFLAADTEGDMGRWVDQLRALLHLQDEGPVSFAPRLHHSQSTNIPSRKYPIDNQRQNSTPASSADSVLFSPTLEIRDPFDSPPNGYYPLDKCSSGGTPTLLPRAGGRNHPPLSSQQSSYAGEYCNFSDEDDRGSGIYKVPQERDSDIYKVPASGRNVPDSTYDYPPPSSAIGREWNRDSTYDYPPPLNSLNDGDGRDSTYDYPPTSVPRRSNGSDSERPLWECKSKQTTEDARDIYDIPPPSSSRTSNPLPPPKAHPTAPKVHRYINAAPAPVSNVATPPSPARGSADDGIYLAMTGFEPSDGMYMPMAQMANSMAQMANSMARTANSSPGGQCRRMKSAVLSPAPRTNEKPKKAPVTLPRNFAKDGGSLAVMTFMGGPVMDSFHDTQGTRSFKRRVLPPGSENVILPQKVGTTSSSSSSSDDEDENGSKRNSAQEYFNLKNSASSDNEALTQQGNPDVQYLDLDLNASPNPRSSVGPSCSDSDSKIEYNEIDVERTKALFDAKLTLEKERSGSDLFES